MHKLYDKLQNSIFLKIVFLHVFLNRFKFEYCFHIIALSSFKKKLHYIRNIALYPLTFCIQNTSECIQYDANMML